MSVMTAIILFLAAAFVFGSVIGSFLNVCIARIPLGESVVRPRSRCPKCERAIPWYQNIPLLSYAALRGRCAGCDNPISFRYPLVEAMTGLLFALTLWFFGFTWATPIYWAFIAMLLVVTFIDLDHQIIPNVISLPGMFLGVLSSFLIPWMSWSDSLLGVLAGGGTLWLVAAIYFRITGAEGMGMGDVKLLAMIGAFLGYKSLLLIILASSFLGALVGVMLMLLRGGDSKYAIPFGPYLSLGALLDLFCGDFITDWYFGFF